MSEGKVDVVVVGAGLAGLTAATELADRGLSVTVLEARSEVGGRTRSRSIAGQAVDLGAEYVGPNHARVRRLASRLGLNVRRSGVLSARTKWELSHPPQIGHLPPIPARDRAKVVTTFARWTRAARRLPVDRPWASPHAAQLDAISYAEWLDAQRLSGAARRQLELLAEDTMIKDAEHLSMLHWLWMIRRSGDVVTAFRDIMGARVDGGTQQLALGLATRLGNRVELERPVARLEQDQTEVVVETQDRERRHARHAIVCVPLPAVLRLDFSPALPDALEEARQALSSSFGEGTTVVVGAPAAAPARFGLVVGNEHFGSGWRRGSTAKANVRYAPANTADTLAAVLAHAADIPEEDRETRSVTWSDDPFIGGTYVVFEPGQLTRYGPLLTRAHGRIHFAAAERSTWPDFMEGAIESGSRAAADVAAQLGAP